MPHSQSFKTPDTQNTALTAFTLYIRRSKYAAGIISSLKAVEDVITHASSHSVPLHRSARERGLHLPGPPVVLSLWDNYIPPLSANNHF